MIDYDILGSYNHYSLVSEVRQKMSQGWEPIGNMVVSNDKELSYKFYQPMIHRG